MSDAARVLTRPFTTDVTCRLAPPIAPADGRPPLFVCLHGQGQTGARQQRWMGPAVPERYAAAFPDGFHGMEVRRAERPVRIGRAWYLYSTEDRDAFLASLDQAVDALWQTVDAAREALGADPSAIWLGGFSQGAYLTQVAALRHPERVAGWVAQAGGFREDYIPGGLPALDGKPVLLQHGDHDEALPAGVAHETADLLRNAGADVTFQSFDAGHVITPEMAAAVRVWLDARG
jgi:phospholipase/carboxylesterase